VSLYKPNRIEEYVELREWLDGLSHRGRSGDWKKTMRWYAQNDLFFLLTDVCSWGKTTICAETGERLYDHQFYLDWARDVEYQLEQGGGVDASSRSAGKSTIRTHTGTIQRLLQYPNSAGCIFSYQRKAALKHVRVIKDELENNETLKFLFDDILYDDPISAARRGDTVWNMDEGLRIKRNITRKEASVEHNSFMHGTPTGGRFDRLDFDDIEDWKSLNTKDLIDNLHHTFDASLSLLTPTIINPPVIMMTNTFYSENGLVWRIMKEYADHDPRMLRKVPGEDLSEAGDGPLGGTARYPWSNERLHFIYGKMGDKSEYASQICCDFLAGEERILDKSLLTYYRQAREFMARDRHIYVCIDPSKGIVDPMCIWVWGLGSDRKVAWLDAYVGKLDPALPEFYDKIFHMVSKWGNLGERVIEVRVENYGQSIFDSTITKALQEMGNFTPVVSCADNMKTGKFSSGKSDREFERWAMPLHKGELLFPMPVSLGGEGIPGLSEDGVRVDLVDYFIDKEMGRFPKPVTDNMLDAGALIWEPEEKVGGCLLYPTPKDRQKKQHSQRTTWMSAG